MEAVGDGEERGERGSQGWGKSIQKSTETAQEERGKKLEKS